MRTLLVVIALTACDSEGSRERAAQLEPALFDYRSPAREECTGRTGAAGKTDGERSAQGIRYNVRAPRNYDPARRHPLLLVFAPARFSAAASERLTGLTHVATERGFIVAYADHARLGVAGATALGAIARELAAKWCIDTQRVYLTGHSDGGSVAHIAAVLPATRDIVAGIAPSAAGVKASDLTAYGCRAAIPVLVLHGSGDTHFPGFGADAAKWWARCNGCDASNTRQLAGGCVAFARCAPGGETWYCEGTQSHREWPDRNAKIVEFLGTSD